MKDPQDPHRERYQQARIAFEELSIEERTLFLIKETINTIAAGVDDAVDKVSEEFETLFRQAAGNGAEAHAEEAPPKAKTSTRKKATTSKSTSTRSRKTTTKKTTPRKPRSKKDDDAGDA